MTVVLGDVAAAWSPGRRKQALAEAARAQAMQEFMVGLFDQAGGAAPGQAMDLRSLLSTAEARDTQRARMQPRTRAELLGLLARLRLGLGDYAEAAQLLREQALIVDSHAQHSAQPAAGIADAARATVGAARADARCAST